MSYLPIDPHVGCAKLLYQPSYRCFSAYIRSLSEINKRLVKVNSVQHLTIAFIT